MNCFLSNLLVVLAVSLTPGLQSASVSTPSLLATNAGTAFKDTIEKTEVTLNQAINIVEKRRLTECVARTICELSCDPEIYGAKGQSVHQILKQFESDTQPKLSFYKTAKDKGQALPKTKCNECTKLYANCKTPTETLLRLANALTIKS